MSAKKERKFEIGDRVRWKRYTGVEKGTVTRYHIEDQYYVYWEDIDHEGVNLEGELLPLNYKVKATTVARKMNKGKIIADKDGWLLIKGE